MKSELDMAFAKLTNPRMSAGLMILYSLLEPLKSKPISATEVKNQIERIAGKDKTMSKQSITNAARRLEEVKVVDRAEGYSVNYGYLISLLLRAVIRLNETVKDLEEEVANLKLAARKTD